MTTNTDPKNIRTSRHLLVKRLKMYWQAEGMNIFLVPLLVCSFAYTSEQPIGVATFFNFIPMCALFLVGTLYWRAKLRHLQGNKNAVAQSLKPIATAQRPLLLLTIAAVGISIAAFAVPNFASSSTDKWSSFGVMVLVVLEYVNYYHRQVQHFDHWADFQRLCSGKGFRKSALRADLERLGYRNKLRD